MSFGKITLRIKNKLLVKVVVSIAAIGMYLPQLSNAANVSLRNGNFFTGFTDLFYEGGFEPKIQRIYNSKSIFKSIFGFGWSNEYEVFLTVAADGTLIVHEAGGGPDNRFTPENYTSAELAKGIDNIVAAAQKEGGIGSKSQLDAYKDRLRNEPFFRDKEWEKYKKQGKVQGRQVSVGQKFYSSAFNFQVMTKVANGYMRTESGGKIETFNENGKLTRISDKNGNFIDLTYSKDGHLQKIVDNFNRKIFFEFNRQGLVSKIDGEDGKHATYQFNNEGDMISSRDAVGHLFQYKYDKLHNLTEIKYSNEPPMVISYYDKNKFYNVKSFKDRDGELTEYTYDKDPRDKGHSIINVTVKDKAGKLLSTSKYEYFTKKNAFGDIHNTKLITVIDGDRTETSYNDSGLPVLIKNGSEESRFEYDSKGHVTKKLAYGEVTELHYDPRAEKVDQVRKYSLKNPKKVTWSQFQYDDKANLITAKNSDGKAVKLLYDNVGRIQVLVDQDHHQISFKYNELSKPIEIKDASLGTITVTYTNSGEIKKVDSPAGQKIAVQVTTAFQNLLDIIRPAGVTLSL